MTAPDVSTDTVALREEECSGLCTQQICEWCPGHDRFEAVAQWLYTAIIARQDKIPSDDVTPWSELTKDQRNGWRGWATELLALIDRPQAGPLRDLIAERDQAVAAVERVERIVRSYYVGGSWSSQAIDDIRRALDPS